MVFRKPSRLQNFLYVLFFVSTGVISLTKLGFPYSGEKTFLAPHRGFALHTERKFYSKVEGMLFFTKALNDPLQSGELTKSDAGFFIVNLDRNSPRLLFNHVPEMSSGLMREIGEEECERHLFCAMPFYYPASTLLK